MKAGGAAAILILLSLFTACTDVDMGTLYPSSGSYQVRALVNGNSLESCSIVRLDDQIRPYFAASVINDPDLTGLLVYLQNPQGEVAGGRIRYMLHAYANELDIPAEEAETEEIEEIAGYEETSDTEVAEISDKTVDTEAESTAAEAADEERLNSDEILMIVRSFDKDLPYFLMPQNLETGSYSLVFEAIGRRGTLSRMETDIYYLADFEFTLKDISMYLSGISGSQLIQPEATVLLEAGLDFDKRLDPYVIWYRGKIIVSQGRISEGAGSLLWKAPEQAGIYSMRLEAFPTRLKPNLNGIVRDISLPVSPKAVNSGYFFDNGQKHPPKSSLAAGTAYPELLRSDDAKPPEMPAAPELLQWYQFSGDLYDSISVLIDEKQFVSVNQKPPRWEAVRQSYGLSIGPDDSFSVSPVNFFKTDRDQGGGIFLLHIRPIAQGDIFSAFFPAELSSTEGAWIHVTSDNNNITLQLSTGDKTIKTPLYSASPESQAFIPVVVEFYIRPHNIEAKLSLGQDNFLQQEAVSITLSGPLTGEGRIMIGSTTSKPAFTIPPQVIEIDSTPPEIAETDSAADEAALSTIWNEFAILLSETPLLPEEIPEETDLEETAEIEPVTEAAAIETASPGEAAPSPEEADAELDDEFMAQETP